MTTTPQEIPEEVWLIARNGACVSGAHFANIEAANHQIEQLRNYAGQAGYKAILVGGSALIARETAQLKIMFGTENLHLRGRIDDLETYLKIKTDAVIQLETSHARLLEAVSRVKGEVCSSGTYINDGDKARSALRELYEVYEAAQEVKK